MSQHKSALAHHCSWLTRGDQQVYKKKIEIEVESASVDYIIGAMRSHWKECINLSGF